MSNFIRKYFTYFLFPIVIYCIFFFPIINTHNVIAGKDGTRYSYPARFYLWDSLKDGRFPFWTEKIFGGFAIYADSEHAYLNPLNIISSVLFGPFSSYKFLHFSFYYLGSLCFLFFLERKHFSKIASFVSVTIYYFSFFLLYHQQHFSMTLTGYLIPAGIFLLDLLLSTHKPRWALFLALITATVVSFGSYQAVVIFGITHILYFFSYIPKDNRKKIYLNISIFLTTTLFLCIPQLLSTRQLYMNSDRHTNSPSYTEGSFNPFMIINVAYPYIFGKGDSYKWNTVSNDYQIHETYVYVGISSFMLFVLGYLNLTDRRMKRFINLCVSTFMILGFIYYIPVLNVFGIPIINLFRYWGRSVIVLVFAVAISVGWCLTNPSLLGFKKVLKNPYLIVFSLLFIVQVVTSLFIDNKSSIILQQIKNRAIVFDLQFYIWVIIAVFTILAFFLLTKLNTKYQKAVQVIILSIIIFDLYYFGNNIVKKYTKPISDLYDEKTINFTDKFEAQRIVVLSDEGDANAGMYFRSWGILGWTAFTPVSLSEASKSLKSDSSRMSELYKIGVSKILDKDGNVINEFTNTGMLNNFYGTVLYQENSEGSFIFRLNSERPQYLSTYINNYPGWVIKVNNKKISQNNEKEMFLSFPIPQGDVEVSLVFVPKVLYVSTVISSLGLLASFLIYRRLLNSGRY